jgi:hypothetical protein
MTKAMRYIMIAVLMLALSACGYSIKRSTVDSVRIGDIENMTSEAKLEDRLTEALLASFLKNGIKVTQSSGHSVEGTLETLELRQLSEKSAPTTTSQVVIKGEFFLVQPEGEKKELPGGGKYIVTFSSEGALTPIIANKELAIERALNDIAEEISAAVLYMR